MSIVVLSKKTNAKYKKKISGKPPGGHWLPQGPFGTHTTQLQNSIDNYGQSGFSINGSHRNIGYIGKSSAMSKSGTPFRGLHAIGYGGFRGQYNRQNPVLNVPDVLPDVMGNQHKYIKQSVLSTQGMINKKYRWIKNGVYPNYWVQPIYTGNQTDSKSQGVFIHKKTTGNLYVSNINNSKRFVGYIRRGGATGCNTSTANRTFNAMSARGLYTKDIGIPMSSSEHTLYIQRPCSNPTPSQKPFPYSVQTGTGILTGGINVTNVGTNCNIGKTYTVTPQWYIK